MKKIFFKLLSELATDESQLTVLKCSDKNIEFRSWESPTTIGSILAKLAGRDNYTIIVDDTGTVPAMHRFSFKTFEAYLLEKEEENGDLYSVVQLKKL